MAGRIDTTHPPRQPHLLQRISEQDLRAILACLVERDVDLRQVADLISARPGLESFVMTAANSVGHGLEYRVRDARHAVVLLGIRRMLRLFGGQLEEIECRDVA
ncbi:MAG: HDOD domain-containing protein [Maioricimonas sp. JB049]